MTQRLLGAGFALFGLAIIVLSLQLPAPIAAARIHYGPGFFPIILGIVTLGGGILLAVLKPEAIDPAEGEERYGLRDFLKPLMVCVAALIYIYFSAQIGFLLLSPVILIALLLLGRVELRTALAVGIVVPIIIHVVFAKLLLVPLPLGLLTPWGAYL